MMSFFNLTLSEKHLIFPSILNDSFAGYSNLGCRSLRLILGNVIMMCLGVFVPPWVQLLWDSLSFLDFLEVYFLCQLREVLLHYLFK